MRKGFNNPPKEAKLRTWWHWLDGNVTREGITADLEAMHRVGIQEATLFNGGMGFPAGDVKYLSPEWLDLVHHAVSEAKRLGMELSFHNCAGWSSSGGPWVKPEDGMQTVTISQQNVLGGKATSITLEQPATRLDCYRDIAVLAFPTPKSDTRIDNLNPKALANHAYSNHMMPGKPDIAPEAVVRLSDIMDLTSKMKSDGTLEWDAPSGNWTILRIGFTPTGRQNAPAPAEGRGLEVDKMSRKALDNYWAGGMQPILDKLGPLVGTAFTGALVDSYEVGCGNWTEGFDQEFQNRRHYDIRPYLATLAGYYVESCTVLSGTATCTINGNTVTVAAEADCTVQVNFAPKPTYTVNFVASGVSEGSQSALVLDNITLPTTVSTTAAGWTFVGWMDHQIDETAEKPTYYAPGASYTVTGNATLYAVYSRVEEGGSIVYELLTAAPTDWAGNYVITNNATSTSGMYVLKGVTGSASGTNAENANNCTVFSSTGITLDGSTMSNVPNDYVITLAANGSNYTVKSAGTGCYYGMNSSSYLYAYSSINSSYCNWTPAINANGLVQLKNAANGSYPYFSWSTSNNYFWSGSSSNANVLKLWKEANGSTTYYWTDPVVAEHEHEMVYHAAAAPTCTVEGNSAYYQCSVCGKCFTDANGENEIALADTVIAALGHDYVATVTPPTETQQGYTTHVCSRCGDTYVDSYVPALGSDFTVHFSVPEGVTKPADMVSNTNTGITLPTVEGPEGYTFLGWVTEDYDNVETRPATILTGNYIAPQEITLKALFSYLGEGSGETVYQLVDAPENGGKYIIIENSSISGTSGYAMGNTIVANNHYLNAVSVTVNSDNTVTASNVANILWEAAQGSTGFTFWNAAVSKYAGLDSSEYLYPSATAVEWAYTSEGYLNNQIDSEGYYYLSFDSTNTRYTTNKSGKVINFYAETTLGTTIYTTIIGEEHVHTPGDPVVENNVAATCTAAGSYDSVVYCTECGEELSRETVTVPALGHDYVAVVTEPTCTEAGFTTYTCSRCGDTYTGDATEALGHLPGEAV
ncbi:MAG: InlB B-repeat-containing protein, partial [Oscillospiraceae bacterium]|nr:InlB B-repeat-containing protein [Oscillospiraceae bacterium]